MAILTVSNVVGVTATYTTIAAAIAAAANNDTIEIRGGTYGSFTCPSGKKLIYRFLHGAKVRGNGIVGITIGTTTGNEHLADFHGLDIAGFGNQIISYAIGPDLIARYYDCRFRGVMAAENSNAYHEYTRCSFVAVDFSVAVSQVGGACAGGISFCTFVDCTGLGTYTKIGNQSLGFNNNVIHDSSFWMFADFYNYGYSSPSGYREDNWAKNIISGECTFKAIASYYIGPPQFDAIEYVAISSVEDMQAKIIADSAALGAPSWTLTTTDFTFKTISLDVYNFRTSEENYILNRHAGFGRYAKTVLAANFEYSPYFTFVGDFLLRAVSTDATAQAVLTFQQARKIRRLELHFSGTTTGAEYFGGAVNGSIPLTVEASYDGVNYLAPITALSGLIDTGGGVYNFDLPTALFAKTLRVSVTLTGATSGLVRINGVSAEAETIEDQIAQTAGRLAINQLGPAEYGYFLVDAPYSADFAGTVLTARQAKDDVAITKVYSDSPENTNIISLTIAGETFNTFEPQELNVTGVRAVTAGLQANKKVIKAIEPPCDFSLKMVKFLNRFGVWDYILFYGKSETKSNKSDSEYIETLNGYRNVGGDLQYQYRMFRNDFPLINEPLLSDLDRNQNIWLASKWQISATKRAITNVGNSLTTYQRLVKYPLNTDAEYFAFAARFAAGDSVTLLGITEQLPIFGTVTQLSRIVGGVGGFMLIAFETAENDTANLLILDVWVADETLLFVAASPAWEAVTFQNMSTIEDGHGQIFVELQLKGQPEAAYRI